MTTTLAVSVIIPVYNQTEELARCLLALCCQTLAADFEILVIDNGSEENIKSITDRFEKVQYKVEKKIGSYAARNTGIQHAASPVLAFTDADCIPDKNWLKQGLSFLKETGCDAAGGNIQVFARSDRPNYIEFYDSTLGFRQQRSIVKFNYSVTANLFVQRSSFDRIGLFDRQLKSGGDVEWCKRLVKNNGRLCYAEDVLVKHPAISTLRKFRRKYTRVAGGRYQKENFNFRKILLTSYIHLKSIKRMWKEADNNKLVNTTSKKINIVLVHCMKVSTYIFTYFKLFLGKNPERE